MANRLQLDFSLQYSDERADFLTQYLNQHMFKVSPPTTDELETMGNYVLWGKNRLTGLNAKQDKSVPLTSRTKDWDKDDKCESLDMLMESPIFNEASLSGLDAPQLRVRRESFSREEALAKCPDFLVGQFRQLFRDIDELDLKINYYELLHGKRVKEPREVLLRKFNEVEQVAFQEIVTHWSSFTYLRQRHHLVELRRQQYTLRDSYSNPMPPNIISYINEPVEPAEFDAGIEVLPLGTWNKSYQSRLIFKDEAQLNPDAYSEEDLTAISNLYWTKKNYVPGANQLWIDFRDLEHVYQLLLMYEELDYSGAEEKLENYTAYLMRTLRYYIDAADLTPIQQDILNLKLQKNRNADIADIVNKKYHRAYTVNYISTIFRQRIIPKINDAARHHEAIISNLFFPEEFKKCSCCGRLLLRSPDNFIKKTRSTDGYNSRCKKCDKIVRSGGTIK